MSQVPLSHSQEDLSKIIEIQQEIVTSDRDAQGLMELICLRTQELTKATGAVVEMVEGEEMVYRACTGKLVASIGLRLKLRTSLSGQAVLSEQVLYCMDSETDPRVDREACRRVGAISMICVPLIFKNKPVGILKVVSSEAHAFAERDVNVLRLTAGLLSAILANAGEKAEKALALASLQASEKKFRTLTESAFEAILISKNGLSVEANPSFCRMFGYSNSEIPGKNIFDYVVAQNRNKTIDIIKSSSEQVYETICLHKDGTKFDVEATGKNIEINGEMIRVTTVRNISHKKRSEDALRQSESQSREAAQLKADFLANMSHEIRTPLNGVLGMLSMLLETPLNEKQRQYSELAKRSADTLLSLVNDILDFSKLEAKKVSLENFGFELKQSVSDINEMLEITAQGKNLKLSYSLSEDLPQFVSGDPNRMRQVLSNLTNNAIKFTSKGSVQVKLYQLPKDKEKSLIRFEVTDTGIGISEKALTTMFQPFSQADASTTRKFGGTGLGLSICRELVQLMGGEIGVESKEDVGSKFWFTLYLPKAATAERSLVPVKIAPSQNQLHVLIAEDNKVNQMIAAAMVEKMGHTHRTVLTGREAVEILQQEQFDVILMDCQMPEMDGFEATKKIRSSSGSSFQFIPIVAMTANAMAGDREKCLAAGMTDYVPKPTVFKDLHEAIERSTQIVRSKSA